MRIRDLLKTILAVLDLLEIAGVGLMVLFFLAGLVYAAFRYVVG